MEISNLITIKSVKQNQVCPFFHSQSFSGSVHNPEDCKRKFVSWIYDSVQHILTVMRASWVIKKRLRCYNLITITHRHESLHYGLGYTQSLLNIFKLT